MSGDIGRDQHNGNLDAFLQASGYVINKMITIIIQFRDNTIEVGVWIEHKGRKK